MSGFMVYYAVLFVNICMSLWQCQNEFSVGALKDKKPPKVLNQWRFCRLANKLCKFEQSRL